MRLAKYDRDVMIINSRTLRGIASVLQGCHFPECAEELRFIADTLIPQEEKEE